MKKRKEKFFIVIFFITFVGHDFLIDYYTCITNFLYNVMYIALYVLEWYISEVIYQNVVMVIIFTCSWTCWAWLSSLLMELKVREGLLGLAKFGSGGVRASSMNRG